VVIVLVMVAEVIDASRLKDMVRATLPSEAQVK
jgi:hypothetical protein